MTLSRCSGILVLNALALMLFGILEKKLYIRIDVQIYTIVLLFIDIIVKLQYFIASFRDWQISISVFSKELNLTKISKKFTQQLFISIYLFNLYIYILFL